MVLGPANCTSNQSGHTFVVPSCQPPPLPQPNPFRSPLMTLLAGNAPLDVLDAIATPPFAASATFVRPGGGARTTDSGADVRAAPRSSIATAVRSYVPAMVLVHVVVNSPDTPVES